VLQKYSRLKYHFQENINAFFLQKKYDITITLIKQKKKTFVTFAVDIHDSIQEYMAFSHLSPIEKRVEALQMNIKGYTYEVKFNQLTE